MGGLELDQYKADFASKPIAGVTAIGLKDFSAPLYSQITTNLWMGGTPATYWGETGPALPDLFKAVINLYPWEKYDIPQGVDYMEVEMYDSEDGGVDREQIYGLAAWAFKRQKTKTTLIHCQAGLNRSGLVTGLTLMLMGYAADEAVALMRMLRSDAVLINPKFEKWLREQDTLS